MGLNDGQIRTILHYEEKGGQFRTKADVQKMYCIDSELYNRLEPYINIPPVNDVPVVLKVQNSSFVKTQTMAQNQQANSLSKKENIIIELNTTDTLELVKLKGIGTAIARWIIDYRNKLGGYHHKEQLMEVYRIDKEKYDLIKDNVIVDPTAIRKININMATAEELLKVPFRLFLFERSILLTGKQPL